nr:MAG TPA: hypothetical protein [Caudoviricetes sp.]
MSGRAAFFAELFGKSEQLTERVISASIVVSISDCRPLSIEKRFSFDWGRFILP